MSLEKGAELQCGDVIEFDAGLTKVVEYFAGKDDRMIYVRPRIQLKEEVYVALPDSERVGYHYSRLEVTVLKKADPSAAEKFRQQC